MYKKSHVRILFLLCLLFVAVINPYSIHKFLIFKYSSSKYTCVYNITNIIIQDFICLNALGWMNTHIL